jgi:signal transduction histidine kinase
MRNRKQTADYLNGLKVTQIAPGNEGSLSDSDDREFRVLVVDDEPEIVEEISEYLRSKGFDCDTAFDGEQALEHVLRTPDVAVVLTDVRMPGMDGVQLLQRIRDEADQERVLEVIILTGHAGRDEAIAALQAGVTDFLVKPLSLRHLAHTVERAVKSVRSRRMEKRYRESLEAALAEERRLSRLQGEFVSMVSHEFRTPLAIIDGTAQRLIRRKDTVAPDEVLSRSQKIRNAVTRMTDLIDVTLYASRLDAGKIECLFAPCDLAALLARCVERQAEISPTHQISVDVSELPAQIHADQRLLEQVFTNVLSNAVKYAPGNPHIEVQGRSNAARVVISIRDFGVGIPAKELPRLFERYFRASTSAGIPGTGIGLNLVKRLVEMHGGSVDISSSEGNGTTFIVHLPVDARTAAGEGAATRSTSSHRAREPADRQVAT